MLAKSDFWKVRPLGSLVESFDSFRVPVKETDRRPGPYPYYGASGIIDYTDSYIFEGEYLLVAEDGENLRTRKTPIAFMATGKFWVNNHAHIIRGTDGVNTSFLMYALESSDISAFLTGSTLPKLTQGSMNRIPIWVPPLWEQTAIAGILGTLDAKINLNVRMNYTLEAMARAVFKSWFVDFDPVREGYRLFPNRFHLSPSIGAIPVGWSAGTLMELVDMILGGDWGSDIQDTDTPEATLCIRGADIPSLQNAGTGKMPVRYLKPTSLSKRALRDGDIVVEVSGGSPTQSTGRPVLVSQRLLERLAYPLACSNFCRMVRPRLESSAKFLYYWLLWLYSNDEFLQYENGTTGIKNLAFTAFAENYRVVIPPPEVLEEFDRVISPLLDMQQCNGAESETLTSIRDALLPKLLSGEIRVKQAEKIVGEAT